MWRSFRLTDSFSQKYVLTAKRCWWRPGALLNFLYRLGQTPACCLARPSHGRVLPKSSTTPAAAKQPAHTRRGNSTKNPSPRQNPTERPTDPARCGKGGPKGGIKEEPNAQALCRKNLDFFPDDRQTPARREARNHRSEDAEMLGPLPRGPQRTGRADQREARGDANRDRSTQNHRRRVLLSATQRPRSTNNETTTTTRHPELRDPRSDSSEYKLRGVACSFIERH